MISEVAASPVVKPGAHQAFATQVPQPSTKLNTLELQAASDPIAFFEELIKRYNRSVRDYTCTFSKMERLGGVLTPMQVTEAMFRENPFSVRLKWIKNQDKCSRVLYVANEWKKDGSDLAVVEPGAIARLFVPFVMRPIHGEDARKSSRRTIDQFGFRNSLELTLKYCLMAREKGILDFQFKGNDEVGGRKTLVFERHLPYTGENGIWPDRLLIVHIDQELLIPILCQAYADMDKNILLGHYEMSNIRLNPELPESTFTKEGMGF